MLNTLMQELDIGSNLASDNLNYLLNTENGHQTNMGNNIVFVTI